MFRVIAVGLVLMGMGSSEAAAWSWRSLLAAPDEAVRKQAIKSLRTMGAEGLRIAAVEHERIAEELQQSTESDRTEFLQAESERCRASLDQIAGQYNASTLYWYTDLEKAKALAIDSGKPILSLRLLGKLTDEYSCANSRFFRTTLYTNAKISKVLQEKFVLHWQTVRPVPKVTIDFGDGRTLCRTLTGNSAHYLLSAEGRPLDVLPGLYSPQKFLRWLQSAEGLHGNFCDVEPDHRKDYLAKVHAKRLARVTARLTGDLRKMNRLDVLAAFQPVVQTTGKPPTALEAAPIAHGKAKIEGPILRQIEISSQQLEEAIDHRLWKSIAALHRKEVQLDGNSVALIRRENPDALQAGAIAAGKRIVEDPILRMVRKFEDSIALDTVRNEYLLHRRIHEWFAQGEATDNVDALNERVYTELFLTPSSDPWLGLAPADGYTALEDAGLSVSEKR